VGGEGTISANDVQDFQDHIFITFGEAVRHRGQRYILSASAVEGQ
jgi:hypothetical protein